MAQRLEASHVVLSVEGVKVHPLVIRYCWPAELDAMARVAGLELAERYGDYDRRPFTGSSTRHVSVYRRVPPRGPNG